MSALCSYLFPAEGASIYRMMKLSNSASGRLCRVGQMMTVTPTDNRMMMLGSDAHNKNCIRHILPTVFLKNYS